jgi:nucleotide-binding universal stress UspA family protein
VRLEPVVVEGPAAEVVLNEASEKSADLIVITKGALLGPTAERIIQAAQVPVLTIPIQEKAKSDRLVA